jgi:hypothetical protein
MKKILNIALAGVVLSLVLQHHIASAQELRVARTAIPPSRGIPFTAVSQPGVGIWSLIYDTLTRIDNQGHHRRDGFFVSGRMSIFKMERRSTPQR